MCMCSASKENQVKKQIYAILWNYIIKPCILMLTTKLVVVLSYTLMAGSSFSHSQTKDVGIVPFGQQLFNYKDLI